MPMRAYTKEVRLKDGRRIMLRPLTHDDFEALHAFLHSLPEEDRLFLRQDVRDPQLVQKWVQELDADRIIPLLALEDDRIVGSGRIHMMNHGWMQHVGHMRLITARTHRRKGLGGLIARELVDLAAERRLEKIQAHVIEDDVGAVKMCTTLGFKTAAILEGMVKDQSGRRRNLAIMVNDVSDLTRIMEDWIRESMVPAYRVPGGGA